MVAGVGTMTTTAPTPAVGGNGGCVVGSEMSANPQGGTTNEAKCVTATTPTRTRASENRRSNKPIMEKRRRARINNCLNELKTLILDAMKKDPARHSKLEKADILEMTVKHLESLQRQQVAMAAASDPNIANKFRAGFTECAGEVGRFPGLDGPVKRRLLQHLANCLDSTTGEVKTTTPTSPAPVTAPTPPQQQPTQQPQPSQVQVHIVRAAPDAAPILANANSNIILANPSGHGVQLVPTRLPNGDIALILPSSNTFRTPSPSASSASSGPSPLPVLIPIPNRSTSPSDRTSPPRQITILTATASANNQRLILPAQQDTMKQQQRYDEIRVVTPREIESYRTADEDIRGEYAKDDRETFLHIPDDEASALSPASGYEGDRYDGYYSSCEEMQKPLALVTRKRYDECEAEEERPWRPW